jgi:hypothetical protein
MKLATWLGAVATAGASAAAVVLGPLAPASAQPSVAVAAVLIEDPSCAARGVVGPAEAQSAPTGPGVQAVSVTVPAVVLLRVDGAGRVVAASTNTGCAPRAGDEVYTVQGDGSLTRTPVLPMIDWRGDFTVIGVFQPQQG